MTPFEPGIAASAAPPATTAPTIAPTSNQRTRPNMDLRIAHPFRREAAADTSVLNVQTISPVGKTVKSQGRRHRPTLALDIETDYSEAFLFNESRRFAAADVLKDWVSGELAPDLGATFAADLLGYALGCVDWQEIAHAWLDDA